MNTAVTFNFGLTKNERVYQLIIMPGAPFEELYEVLAEFDKEIREVQSRELAAAEAKKAEAERVVSEPETIEPEVVTPISE